MEKTSFRLVFGDSPVVKVLDFFIDIKKFQPQQREVAFTSHARLRLGDKLWGFYKRQNCVFEPQQRKVRFASHAHFVRRQAAAYGHNLTNQEFDYSLTDIAK